MRSILVLLIIFGSLPFILRRPAIGIIMWSWIAYMAPHRLTWGIAYSMPVALIVGLTTLVSWVINREDRKPIPWCPISVLMLILIIWCGITTIFAIKQPDAYNQWQQFAKIILMAFVTLSVIRTDQYLRWLVWITVMSIGFFTIKGGLFTIMTGGKFHVWGPPQTFIFDNNALALATLMTIPLMNYLARTTKDVKVKFGLYGAMFLSFASAVGSYSRGAFLGMAAVSVLLWMRSRHKVMIGLLGVGAIAVGLSFVPEKWVHRMDTIDTYKTDRSANLRLEAWKEARLIAAEHPVLGGGFGVFNDYDTWLKFGSGLDKPRNVHSIYFEMLGTQGYFGLVLFVALFVAGFLSNRKTKRLAKDNPELKPYRELALMLDCSLFAFAVSGTFLNMATYDLFYNLLTMVVINHVLAVEKLRGVTLKDKVTAPTAVSYVRQPQSAPTAALPKPATATPRSFLRARTR